MSIDIAYLPSIWALCGTGLLILVQLIIADIAGIKAKHRPGIPMEADAQRFAFRAMRAHANTNESVACFMLFVITGILTHADSLWLNSFAWLYVGCRVIHMLFYYWHTPWLRSLSFGISLAALLGLFAISAVALL